MSPAEPSPLEGLPSRRQRRAASAAAASATSPDQGAVASPSFGQISGAPMAAPIQPVAPAGGSLPQHPLARTPRRTVDPRTQALRLASRTATAAQTGQQRRVLADPPVTFDVDLRDGRAPGSSRHPHGVVPAVPTTPAPAGSPSGPPVASLDGSEPSSGPEADRIPDFGSAPWETDELTVTGAGADPSAAPPAPPRRPVQPASPPNSPPADSAAAAAPPAPAVQEVPEAPAPPAGAAGGRTQRLRRLAPPTAMPTTPGELASPDAMRVGARGTPPDAGRGVSRGDEPVSDTSAEITPSRRRVRRESQDAPERAAKTSRAGRNLGAAVAVGVGLGAIALGSLLWRKEIFVGLCSFAVLIAIWELAGALSNERLHVPVVPLGVGAVGMLVSAYVTGPEGLTIAFALTAFGVLLWRIIDGVDGAARDIAAGVFTAAYVPFLAGFSVLMLAAPDGAQRVIVFIATTVSSDIGGYAAGVLFGKHPMAPNLSPKKSWEGFGGSLLACSLVGTAGVSLLLHGPWWAGVVLGVATAISATLGDLAESVLKRGLGVKDMGNLLPGHGGLMDRMDSLLLTAPVAYLVLTALVSP